MRSNKRPLALRTSVLTACFMVGTATAMANGGEKELTIRPMPFTWNVRDADRPSGLFLGLEEERYNKKASEVLAAALPESSDAVAYQVVKAMAKKDSMFLRGVLLDPNDKQVQGWDFARWLRYLDTPEDPILLRVYRLGKASLYVLKGRLSGPLIVPILITPSQGKHFFDLPGQNSPLCGMVVALNEAIASDPSRFGPVKDLEGYQSMELPSVFGDEDREHPSRLFFKGVRYVAKVYPLSEEAIEQLPTTNDPSVDAVVKFYARVWQTLASGDIDAFADMLCKKNGDFVRKVDKKRLMDSLVGKYHPFRQVNYILYSDNVFWIFYQVSTEPNRTERLLYHVVVWDDATKRYKLVRFFPYLDAMSEFMQWKAFSKELADKHINEEQGSNVGQ